MSTQVEERVRRALAARAGQITPDRLQPAVPPTAAPARRSWRSSWLTLLVAAAAVLVGVVLLVRPPGGDPQPRLPDAPAATVPTPEPTPSSTGAPESAVPSPVATSTAPTASPTTNAPEPEVTPPGRPASTP
jgi:hypothetical protein